MGNQAYTKPRKKKNKKKDNDEKPKKPVVYDKIMSFCLENHSEVIVFSKVSFKGNSESILLVIFSQGNS